MRGGAAADFVVDAPDERQRALLEALREGAAPIDALGARLAAAGHPAEASELGAAVEELGGLGLLEEPPAAAAALLTAEQRERYDRQLAYFADLQPGGAAAAQAAPGGRHRRDRRRRRPGHLDGRGAGVRGRRPARAPRRRPRRAAPTSTGRSCTGAATSAAARSRSPRTRLRAFNPDLDVVGRARAGRRRGRSPRRRRVAPTSWSTPPTGRPTSSAAGSTPRAWRPASRASRPASSRRASASGRPTCPAAPAAWSARSGRRRRGYPLYDELGGLPARAAVGRRHARPGLGADRRRARDGRRAPPDRARAEPATLGAGLIVDLRDLSIRREPVDRDEECPRCGRDVSLAR